MHSCSRRAPLPWRRSAPANRYRSDLAENALQAREFRCLFSRAEVAALWAPAYRPFSRQAQMLGSSLPDALPRWGWFCLDFGQQ